MDSKNNKNNKNSKNNRNLRGVLVLLAWAMDKLLHFPVWSMYLLLPVLLALLLPPLIALIKRIPVLRTWVLGEK